MTIYNVTFFYPPHLADGVRRWLAEAWMPAADAAGCKPPSALAMESAQEGVERLAVHCHFRSRSEADAFAAREASLLVEDMQSRFGAQSVMAFPTVMEEISL
ncbi:MAG: DUF4286 family protein [Muribaculaceae bacterium]|nr:DUF4286 family protein [Muribaculaceae bacterium]